MNRKVVIVDGARTPFDKFGGVLKDLGTVQLAAHVTRKLIERNPAIQPEDIEEYYLGINMPTSNRSIARQAALAAGLPVTINATTTDRACCSSMVAIAMAMRSIQLGDADTAIGGGSENMSNVPYFVEDLRWGKRLGEVVLKDILYVSCPYTGEPRAKQAGEVALEYGVSREMQDEWACRSQKRYDEAFRAGKFENEIVAIELPQKKGEPLLVKDDQSPRPSTTIEALAKLKPVNQSPTVTAGNAPGLSTGAALVLLMNEEAAEKRGIEPLATIVAHAQASEHPKGIAYIPAYAAKKALAKAGMSIEQMDVIEINEAFAAMPLVSTMLLGDRDQARIAAIREKTNVNGGAIAIGHPTGASGARLLMTMAYELKRRGGGHGLCTICGGVGESECFIIEA
jgi:acetyl-CoA C-acetyltransferase